MYEISDDELSKLIDYAGRGYGVDGPETYAALIELRDRRAAGGEAVAWSIRNPGTGKLLPAETVTELGRDWAAEWEKDGFEVIPLYLHPSNHNKQGE